MDSQQFRTDRNYHEPRNTITRFRKTNIDTLDVPHRNAVAAAVSRILSTEIAETTYAQIVDGLPFPGVLTDVYGDLICPDHPIHQHKQHENDTLDIVRRLHDEFDPHILQFDVPVSYLRLIPPRLSTGIGLLILAWSLIPVESFCRHSRPLLLVLEPFVHGRLKSLLFQYVRLQYCYTKIIPIYQRQDRPFRQFKRGPRLRMTMTAAYGGASTVTGRLSRFSVIPGTATIGSTLTAPQTWRDIGPRIECLEG